MCKPEPTLASVVKDSAYYSLKLILFLPQREIWATAWTSITVDDYGSETILDRLFVFLEFYLWALNWIGSIFVSY